MTSGAELRISSSCQVPRGFLTLRDEKSNKAGQPASSKRFIICSGEVKPWISTENCIKHSTMSRRKRDSFNVFQIKRQAHAVSRRDSNLPSDRWNPFRHVWTRQDSDARYTWDSERAPGGQPSSIPMSPIEHVCTAPATSCQDIGNNQDHENSPPLEYTARNDETTLPSQAVGDSSVSDSLGIDG